MDYRLVVAIGLLSSVLAASETRQNLDIFSIFNVSNHILNDVMHVLHQPAAKPPLHSPDQAHMNISDICRAHRYAFDEYSVRTADGYVTAVHRVRKATNSNGKPVFLMHGILDSSDSWVLLGPRRSLAFILADLGYDVWLGNARGNKYSMKHVRYAPVDAAFWDFTWQQIGAYDLPAMIDFVLNESGRKRLHYIGHSQGTTAFFVMCALKPEYNRKISLMFALAPVAWVKNVKSPIVRMFSPVHSQIGHLIGDLNKNSPTTSVFNRLASYVCKLMLDDCEHSLFMFTGASRLIDKEDWPTILGHIPSGSSTKQFQHFGQLIESGSFRRYDYGDANLLVYGQSQPPDYALGNVTVPISLFYSANDWLSDAKDVDVLRMTLKTVFSVHLTSYSHLDYLYAKTASEDVYRKIVGEIEAFESVSANVNQI